MLIKFNKIKVNDIRHFITLLFLDHRYCEHIFATFSRFSHSQTNLANLELNPITDMAWNILYCGILYCIYFIFYILYCGIIYIVGFLYVPEIQTKVWDVFI
jgi:hypothetical protein